LGCHCDVLEKEEGWEVHSRWENVETPLEAMAMEVSMLLQTNRNLIQLMSPAIQRYSAPKSCGLGWRVANLVDGEEQPPAHAEYQPQVHRPSLIQLEDERASAMSPSAR
jgi:hypothetical protein